MKKSFPCEIARMGIFIKIRKMLLISQKCAYLKNKVACPSLNMLQDITSEMVIRWRRIFAYLFIKLNGSGNTLKKIVKKINRL